MLGVKWLQVLHAQFLLKYEVDEAFFYKGWSYQLLSHGKLSFPGSNHCRWSRSLHLCLGFARILWCEIAILVATARAFVRVKCGSCLGLLSLSGSDFLNFSFLLSRRFWRPRRNCPGSWVAMSAKAPLNDASSWMVSSQSSYISWQTEEVTLNLDDPGKTCKHCFMEFKKYYNLQVQLEISLSKALQHINLGLQESTEATVNA